MIDVYTMDFTEHVFTWVNPETSEEMTLATERMAKWCAENKDLMTFSTPVEPVYALKFMKDRGIENHRLARLMEQVIITPLIYLQMGDGTHLLCDGHHRYVAAAMTGRTYLAAYILEKEQWERFVVTGIPHQGAAKLRTEYSGIE